MQATATKIAVHAPWCETALKAIETPSIPEPETNTIATRESVNTLKSVLRVGILTQQKRDGEEFPSNPTKEDETSIVDAVHLGVVLLEDANHVAGPGGDGAHDDEHDGAGDHTDGVKDEWEGQDTQTDLDLEHDDNGSNPSQLCHCQFSVFRRFPFILTHAFVVWSFAGDFSKDGVVHHVGGHNAGLPIVRRHHIERVSFLLVRVDSHDGELFYGRR